MATPVENVLASLRAASNRYAVWCAFVNLDRAKAALDDLDRLLDVLLDLPGGAANARPSAEPERPAA